MLASTTPNIKKHQRIFITGPLDASITTMIIFKGNPPFETQGGKKPSIAAAQLAGSEKAHRK